jgi:hypothetical protein
VRDLWCREADLAVEESIVLLETRRVTADQPCKCKNWSSVLGPRSYSLNVTQRSKMESGSSLVPSLDG